MVPCLGQNDTHEGVKLYKTIQEKPGVVNYATCETSALAAEATLYACSGEAKKTDKEVEEDTNFETKGGMKVLAFDISEKIMKSTDDRMESEQGTPRSDEGKCKKCGESNTRASMGIATQASARAKRTQIRLGWT